MGRLRGKWFWLDSMALFFCFLSVWELEIYFAEEYILRPGVCSGGLLYAWFTEFGGAYDAVE